jgi:arabinan endo-1,5-alpha-L-arabinosidase
VLAVLGLACQSGAGEGGGEQAGRAGETASSAGTGGVGGELAGRAGVAGNGVGGAGRGGAVGQGGNATAGGGTGAAGAGGLGGTRPSGGSGGAGAGAGAAGGGSGGAGKAGAGGRAGAGGGAGSGAAGMGASAGSGGSGDDRCNVAVYDPQKPPALLTLSGNLGAHDPALIEVSGKYYLYATGDGIGAKTSSDLKAWQGAPAVFSANPAWIATEVPGATNLWAPDISFFGGQYHLYYAASTFGSNKSCIGHATRAALDAGSFADHGSVFCSNAGGSKDDFNAIDPNVVLDTDGTPYLAFGSFWSGIKLIALAADGTRSGSELTALADRPSAGGALEGPFIVRRCGYFYLFVSWGACCGDPWDYNIRVGRSAALKGPYVDKAGTALTKGGGTLLVEGNATVTAPGHNAVIFTGSSAYNVYHALNASHQNPVLRVAELAWDADGWPISAGP